MTQNKKESLREIPSVVITKASKELIKEIEKELQTEDKDLNDIRTIIDCEQSMQKSK